MNKRINLHRVLVITAILVIFLCLLFLTSCGRNETDRESVSVQDFTQAPEKFSLPKRIALNTYMNYSVLKGDRSGFVAMFAHNGTVMYENAVGWANLGLKKPMQLDTKMRFASMTKPITAVAALILIENQELSLDDPVSKFIPEYKDSKVSKNESLRPDGSFETEPVNSPLKVKHLLTFSSGIGPGYSVSSDLHDYWLKNGLRQQKSGDLSERVKHLASLPLFENPASKWRYGGSADVLARVVEVVSEVPFDVFLDENIFEPLGMRDTRFLHAVSNRDDLAVVYTQAENGDLVRAPLQIDSDWNEGGSGLVSTASDYMRFALMLWNQGEYAGVRILSEEMISNMIHPH
ncbi:MAG: serine hydrolase domain-containing protein, partial [Pseudomonadota bacterium]|nr:serine hydrolase domain-containing protein [Pseudomonadota bacterium]